jgi:hypothetical protein
MVATDAGITAPIGGFEPGAVIPPISLLGRPVIPACLILQTLSVTWIDHGVEAPNDVGNALSYGGCAASALISPATLAV